MENQAHNEAQIKRREDQLTDKVPLEPTLSQPASFIGAVVTATRAAETIKPADELAQKSHTEVKNKRPGGEDILANVYHDPIRHTVTLLMDEHHANAVIYAVRVVAADYEAHAREVRAVAATLPCDSYGARNRLFIANRHERLANRLRRIESNYRAEVCDG